MGETSCVLGTAVPEACVHFSKLKQLESPNEVQPAR
jgi:hypothetical protein